MIPGLASSFSFLMAAGMALAIAPACGGTPKPDAESPGESGGDSPGAGDDEGGEDTAGQSEEVVEDGASAEGEEGTEGEEGIEPEGPPPAVTFVLRNSHDLELAFNMDLGWQPNLFAYTGKPPRAVSILMFPKFCTESCETPAAERCPTCPQPERAKDILAAQKMEKVAPGEELEVPWDGKIVVYERGRGKGKERCECHRSQDAPPGTYTVKACGLRLTTTAEERSQLQCVEGAMTLPAEEGLRVELDFAAPRSPVKKKKRK
jgi:hypothetical protein